MIHRRGIEFDGPSRDEDPNKKTYIHAGSNIPWVYSSGFFFFSFFFSIFFFFVFFTNFIFSPKLRNKIMWT